ncbi:MAG: M48 family metalloprotease [Pseudomonadales bacterium]
MNVHDCTTHVLTQRSLGDAVIARRFPLVMPNPFALLCLLLAFLMFLPPHATAMSEKKEVKIGKETHEKLIAQTPPYADAELQAYVQKVGQRLADKSSRPHLEWHFTVMDSQTINAFALPGGYVYINRGLLAYLQTEAQLAAVLGHEIGHITAKHASKQKNAGNVSKFLSTVAAVIVGVQTGSSTVAGVTQDIGSTFGSAVVSGYGRDMELESDELGAKYIGEAGYDTQAMVEVIGVLKDQENFERLKAKETGKKYKGYHGLFSSHPRNDQRLLNVIKKAGEKTADVVTRDDDGAFQRHIENMKFSNESLASATIGNRYYNRRLDFTLAFSSGWQIQSRGSVIQAHSAKDRAIIQLRVQKADKQLTPKEYMQNNLKFSKLSATEELDDYGLTGFTGVMAGKDGKPPQRVAVIYHRNRAFIFTAQAQNTALNSFYDTLFLSSIKSFRPLNSEDRTRALSHKITYVRAEPGLTYKELASQSPLKKFPEEELRLLNAAYPRGEPEPGQLIKIVQ